jgi:hypothetical protein
MDYFATATIITLAAQYDALIDYTPTPEPTIAVVAIDLDQIERDARVQKALDTMDQILLDLKASREALKASNHA